MKRTQLIRNLLVGACALLLAFGVFKGIKGKSTRNSQVGHEATSAANAPAQNGNAPRTQESQQGQGGLAPAQTANGLASQKTQAGAPSTSSGVAGIVGSPGIAIAPGSNVAANATGPVAGTPPQNGVTAQQGSVPPCYTLTFKKPSSADLLDDASDTKNLIQLGHPDVNLASVCIRVNGSPVKHTLVSGTQDQFMIDPINVGKAELVASFCTGEAKCSDPCKYSAPKPAVKQKDEFLEAISGESEDGSDAKTAQWQEQDGVKNAEVNKALQGGIREAITDEAASAKVAAAKAHKNGKEVFTTWSVEKENPACFKQEATRKVAAINPG